MNITDLAAMGYSCGLETLEESLVNMQLHWDVLSRDQWIELGFTLAVYQPDLSRKCAEVLGAEECARLDAQFNAWLDDDGNQDDNTKPGGAWA